MQFAAGWGETVTPPRLASCFARCEADPSPSPGEGEKYLASQVCRKNRAIMVLTAQEREPRMIAKLLLQTLIWIVVMGALLFVPAGTLRWPAAWVFFGHHCDPRRCRRIVVGKKPIRRCSPSACAR